MSGLLDINDLKVYFNSEEGVVKALAGVDFTVEKGTFHGLIGETGCGKSVTGLSILQLLDNNAIIKGGNILYKGGDLLKRNEREMQRDIRGNEIAMIFQDPGSSINPVFTIENQVSEA